jgi:hypothetical protein
MIGAQVQTVTYTLPSIEMEQYLCHPRFVTPNIVFQYPISRTTTQTKTPATRIPTTPAAAASTIEIKPEAASNERMNQHHHAAKITNTQQQLETITVDRHRRPARLAVALNHVATLSIIH